ncbi:hypothetical protein HPB52_001189 [Rhipicephalus sanguineus]|uniref:Tick transposon n=1 Tax=Rhipicephalus sanguineus TaxID=34632 RepID=A0A9D4PTL7_RHISA|nr:hypothetical protein HPB52_001189 [Rhipicephalus sanguineus]
MALPPWENVVRVPADGGTVASRTLGAGGEATHDDIALLAHSPDELQALLDICGDTMATLHLRFNPQKCGVMVWGPKSYSGEAWSLQGSTLQCTDRLLNKVGTSHTKPAGPISPPHCLSGIHAGRVKVAVPAVSTRQLVRQQEREEWVRTAEKKSSMTVYMMGKGDIAKEAFFDNSRGSGLLAEARSGVLRTRQWRAHYVDRQQTQCILCNAAEETIEHIVLQCPKIHPPSETTSLQTALGFVEGEDQRKGARTYVELTKQRLEHWGRYGAPR